MKYQGSSDSTKANSIQRNGDLELNNCFQ